MYVVAERRRVKAIRENPFKECIITLRCLRPTRGRITSMVKALKALTDVGGFCEGHRGLYTLSSVRRERESEELVSLTSISSLQCFPSSESKCFTF